MIDGEALFLASTAAFAGAGVGALLAWMALRGRTREAWQHGHDEAAGEAAAESARLTERLANGERELGETKSELAALREHGTRLDGELRRALADGATAAAGAARLPALEAALEERARELGAARTALAEMGTRLEEERKAADGRVALLEQAKERLGDAFTALSAQSLQANNQAFLDLAKQSFAGFQQGAQVDLDRRREAVEALVKPIHETLGKVGTTLTELEKSRAAGQAAIGEQLQTLVATQRQLSTETATLSRALRAPGVGGRWGEIQLKRVVELAGMLEHCDFQTQTSFTTEDGKQRPDLVVRLPGGKTIAVDAKAPLQGYLDALDATDEATRRTHLVAHARAIRGHLNALSAKQYWDRLQPSPEFVVLFLPGETFFSAALEQDPLLIEAGVESRVILATPTTLIALLRAVAYGWRQERMAESAAQVAELGRELHNRVRTFAEHLAKVGKGLDSAVKSYNDAVGSFETRVLTGTRKFKELGAASGDELPTVEPIDKVARTLSAEQNP